MERSSHSNLYTLSNVRCKESSEIGEIQKLLQQKATRYFKIFHCLAVLSPPDTILSELQDMLVDFVWSYKRQLLYQKPDRGGFGLVNLQARILTFRFSLAQRYLNMSLNTANSMLSYNLQKYRKLNLHFSHKHWP